MKLDRPFYQLPVEIDAARMFEEVGQFRGHDWRPDRFNIGGYWSLNLVSYRGFETELQDAPMAATPYLARCPYIRQVLASFDTVFAEVRLRWLESAEGVPPHHDRAWFWHNRLRFHIPVITDPSIRFICDGESVHMAAGEVWLFDRTRLHEVANPQRKGRIHLICDTAGSARFWDLLRAPPAPRRRIDWDPAAAADVVCETTPQLPIATPAEVDLFCFDLFERLAVSRIADAARARQMVDVVDAFRRDWRTTFSSLGAARAGWPRYRELCTSTFAAVTVAASGDPVCDMKPTFEHRLRCFLETGAVQPEYGREPASPGAALELSGDLLIRLDDSGALELRIPATEEWTETDVTELTLLAALARGMTPHDASAATGVQRGAALDEFIASMIARGVLQPPPSEPALLLGEMPAAAHPIAPAATPDHTEARATPVPDARLALAGPIYVRMQPGGLLGVWVERVREYRKLSVEALAFLSALAGGNAPREAAALAGVEFEQALLALLRTCLELGIVTQSAPRQARQG